MGFGFDKIIMRLIVASDTYCSRLVAQAGCRKPLLEKLFQLSSYLIQPSRDCLLLKLSNLMEQFGRLSISVVMNNTLNSPVPYHRYSYSMNVKMRKVFQSGLRPRK